MIHFTDKQREHIKRRYVTDRATLDVLVLELGCNSTTPIKRVLRELGIKRYRGGRRRGEYPVDATGHKKCVDCGITKIAKTDFFPAKISSDGYTVRCKICHQAKNRDLKLKRHFNMSLADYDSLYAQQNGVCAICGSPEVRKAKHQKTYYLAVDHDHATEKVRGLLCSRCNKLLGVLNDDVALCKAAIAYLLHWKAKHNDT